VHPLSPQMLDVGNDLDHGVGIRSLSVREVQRQAIKPFMSRARGGGDRIESGGGVDAALKDESIASTRAERRPRCPSTSGTGRSLTTTSVAGTRAIRSAVSLRG
jgi:hypothetical protein